jgi:hypothetical protein
MRAMTDEIRQSLITHGRRRTAARQKAKQESKAIAELAARAMEQGLSKSEIARLAQITRPALDTMLRE